MHAGENGSNGHAADPTVVAGGDRGALGRILGRAIERTWLTLELLFGQVAVAPRLGPGGPEALDAVFGNSCFDHLTAIPTPFRTTIWRELHTARKAGPLAQREVDAEEVLRQLAALAPVADPRGLQDLEWYALWQWAGEVARDGYPDLSPVFEARAAGGDSLLVGLVTTFMPFEAALEGHPASADAGHGLLPAEHVQWLCEHSEPVEVYLNEAYAGGRAGSPAEAAARVRQGLTYAQQGEYERAVIEFTAAVQADPTAAAPYVHRGDAYRLRGEYERAIADYTHALRLHPDHLLGRLNRGLAYRLTGRPEAAVADLTEALRLDPKNAVALNGRGAAHADLKQYDAAIADHTQALRIDPALAWAYQSRGDAYAGRGEYDPAIADYTHALRLNPHFPLAYANRGNAYRLARDLDRAAADYTEALRLDPLNPRILLSRADTYRHQRRLDLALADCGEAIRLDPTNPAGYLTRGITYQRAGEYDRAVADFTQAEQFDPANPEVFLRRANALRHQESYDRAIADLGRVIELNPRDAVAYVSRGVLFALARQYDPAVADFTEAVRLDPTATQAYLERGRVQALRGDFAAGLADGATALEVDPQFVPAMLVRGGIHLRTGEYAAALAEFDRAIQTNPRYARAFNDRGVARSKLGQLDEAIQDFTQAIALDPHHAPAFSNRANAYQLQQRHEEALRDFAEAVVLDTKYATAYCVERGMVEVGRGNYRLALADYGVALSIDPHNRLAKAARAQARAYLSSDFEVTAPTEAQAADPTAGGPATAASTSTLLRLPTAPPPVVDPADGTPVVDLANPETMAPGPVPRPPAPDTQVGEPVFDLEVASAEERASYEAEQEAMQEQERQKRLKALEEKAEEIRRRNQVAAAATYKAKTQKHKTKERRDPQEVAEQWRAYRRYAIIAAGLLVVLYYGGSYLWSLIPAAPPKEYAVEEFVSKYAKDSVEANDNFAKKPVVLRGKLKLVRGPTIVRGRPGPVKQILFDIPSQSKYQVECILTDDGTADQIKVDAEYRVGGQVQKYKPGTPILLNNAILLSADGLPIAFRGTDARTGVGAIDGLVATVPRSPPRDTWPANFHEVFTNTCLNPQAPTVFSPHLTRPGVLFRLLPGESRTACRSATTLRFPSKEPS
ncbi:MAG TPA: tetratricopeptide repeat protein [Gemmataceae bacterium]|nr:tetratricopeptide repeat protein [Gemmataceae bacterium]